MIDQIQTADLATTRESLNPAQKLKRQKQNRAWCAKNLERSREIHLNYYYRNKGKEKSRAWCKKHPERRREIARNYARRLRATQIGKINGRMSTAIRRALKHGKDGKPWEKLVGYTVQDLHRHIEANFKPGMNWKRFLNGEIHIDHIIPKAKFNYSTYDDRQFKQCWALENLDPKWEKPNLVKNAKLLKPEQIPLGL